MTVAENNSPKVQYEDTFILDQELPIPFPYTEKEHIHCIVNGEEIEYNVDYTILGQTLTLKNEYGEANITIYRMTPLDQQADFPQNNKFNSQKINEALDKICMQQQEQSEALSRCITADISLKKFNGDLPTPASKQVLMWNEDTTALENYDIIGENEAFQESVQEALDDTTAVANEASRVANEASQVANSATDTADVASRTADNAVEIANNANTKADNAIDTATNANTKADNAVDTANEASVTAGTAQDVANSAINTANATSIKVDGFAEDIEKVIEAAEKIDVLEEVVEEAKAEAEAAGIAANEATQAANSATIAAQEATAALSSKQDKFTVGTGLELVNGVLNNTQTSANWGNITGNIENQIDLKEKFDEVNDRINDGFQTKADISLSNLDEAGEAKIRNSAYHPPLLSCMWSDHKINDMSFLLADTFSWQSGDVYTVAYDILVSEYPTGVEETEDGITFKRSLNNFKIATPDMESAILDKYNTDGIAWYYILDTENRRFKLPRTKFGFEGLRGNVGDDIAESLPKPNHTHTVLDYYVDRKTSQSYQSGTNKNGYSTMSLISSSRTTTDADNLPSVYQDNAPVQERATQMYLYFYVGEYARTALEQTAGITSEQLNNKVDTDLSNLSDDGKKVLDGQWVQKFLIVETGANKVGSYSYDLSTYLPNDGNSYEVQMQVYVADDSTTSGTNAHFTVSNIANPRDNKSNCSFVLNISTEKTCGLGNQCGIAQFKGDERTLYTQLGNRDVSSTEIYLYAYRRLGTNQ